MTSLVQLLNRLSQFDQAPGAFDMQVSHHFAVNHHHALPLIVGIGMGGDGRGGRC
jgi:hypothetical protein